MWKPQLGTSYIIQSGEEATLKVAQEALPVWMWGRKKIEVGIQGFQPDELEG